MPRAELRECQCRFKADLLHRAAACLGQNVTALQPQENLAAALANSNSRLGCHLLHAARLQLSVALA